MSTATEKSVRPEKFWTEDLCVLFTNIRVFPTSDMDKDEKLNALTRLALIIAAILYAMKYEYWLTFLLMALLSIILFKYGGKREDKEGFTITPTYASPDMNVTTVAPIFSEEWQIPPPLYDLYENTAEDVTFIEPLQPQLYPNAQYLTRTNLLPSDEQATHMLNGGPRQAREYVNGAFLRNTLAYRDNMTKLYKKRLARRFRSNTQDTFSPYSSY